MKESQSTSPVRSCVVASAQPEHTGAVLGTASLPTPKELTCHYHAAINGLYYAFLFGKMLITIRENLGVLTRENARENGTIGRNGNALQAGGWNAGTGLKGWMTTNCPEINYKSAYRFLQMAEKALQTMATLGLEPTEENIKAFLEGKSQRQLLKPVEKAEEQSLTLSTAERARKLADTMSDFTRSLEGMVRTGETLILTPEARQDLIGRMKAIVRKLEAEM